MPRIVFLDTETTGLHTKDGHRIIEIACLEMIDRKLTDRKLHHYLNPERSIDPKASEVHGITNEMVQGKPLFREIMPELKDFILGDQCIMHNAEFDMNHVDNELSIMNAGWKMKDVCEVMCTLRACWDMDKVWYKKGYKLDNLIEKYGIVVDRKFHGRLLDCQILAKVYLKFTEKWYL
jgi:DNA polymerase-3 subunit epsilon